MPKRPAIVVCILQYFLIPYACVLSFPAIIKQGPASTYHVHQGPGVDQPTAMQLPQGAVQKFSTSGKIEVLTDFE